MTYDRKDPDEVLAHAGGGRPGGTGNVWASRTGRSD